MTLASETPVLSDPRLGALWDKVRAGERLDRDDALTCLHTEDLHGLGRLADAVKSERHGEHVYFVLNRYVNPTNVCVLACSFCDFRRKQGPGGRVRELDRGRARHGQAGHARGAHRRRAPSRLALRVLRAAHPGHPHRAAGDADQGVHRGRDRLLLAPVEDRAGRGPAPAQGCRSRLDARRRRRDLLAAARQAPALHGQGRPGPVVRDPRHRARPRAQDERHHALRTRRDAGRAGRSPAPPPRAAGPLGRLRDVHPALVPGRHHPARAAPDAADRRPPDHRDLAPRPRQFPPHRGVLGDARARPPRRWRCTSAPPTSTAPWRTRRSPTWRWPRARPASPTPRYSG